MRIPARGKRNRIHLLATAWATTASFLCGGKECLKPAVKLSEWWPGHCRLEQERVRRVEVVLPHRCKKYDRFSGVEKKLKIIKFKLLKMASGPIDKKYYKK